MIKDKPKLLLCGGVVLALAACSGGGERGGPATSSRHAVRDIPVKIGAPYRVRGVTYTPADDPDYDAVGLASYYGKEHKGNSTANGERFRPKGISAAHPTLPLPSYAEITSLQSGRTILVRINDRGPFNGRIIDLSHGAASELGIVAQGTAPVRVRRVHPPEKDRAKLRRGKKAEDRPDAPTHELRMLRRKMMENR